eukprot:1744745-Rhodomonas_salina.1
MHTSGSGTPNCRRATINARSLAGVLDDVKKPMYLPGRVVLLLVAFLLLFENSVLFEQVCKPVVDDGGGDLVRRP